MESIEPVFRRKRPDGRSVDLTFQEFARHILERRRLKRESLFDADSYLVLKSTHIKGGRKYQHLRLSRLPSHGYQPDELDYDPEEERIRAYTRNNENAPDPTHERVERTDSPEREPHAYRVTGSPDRARNFDPNYRRVDDREAREEPRFDPRPQQERELEQAIQQEDRINRPQRFDPRDRLDHPTARMREEERGDRKLMWESWDDSRGR